jgi:hypothetical protein
VEGESELRDVVFKAGSTMALRMSHAPLTKREDGDEDGRLCAICRQNSYFSFLACPCDIKKNVSGASPPYGLCGPPARATSSGARLCDVPTRWLAGRAQVCLRHHSKLCKCHPSRHVLFFRHTIHELEGLTAHCRCAATRSLLFHLCHLCHLFHLLTDLVWPGCLVSPLPTHGLAGSLPRPFLSLCLQVCACGGRGSNRCSSSSR